LGLGVLVGELDGVLEGVGLEAGGGGAVGLCFGVVDFGEEGVGHGADEDDGLDGGVFDDGLGERGEGDVFVVAAHDEGLGQVKGVDGGGGAFGCGGDGVVVVADVVDFGDEFESVFEAGELGEGLVSVVVGDAEDAAYGEGGGGVGAVVLAWDLQGELVGVGGVVEAGLCGCEGWPVAELVVVGVEEGPVGGGLVDEDILFGLDVGVHGGVPVEVVGGDVGDDGDVWAAFDGGEVVELEAAEFEDDEVVMGDFVEVFE